MNKPLIVRSKLTISLKSIAAVLSNPTYLLVAVFGYFVGQSIIIWSLNTDLLVYILFEAPISLSTKLSFFVDVFTGIFTTYQDAQATNILVFSVLFGINFSLLVYIIKQRQFKHTSQKTSLLGIVIATIGGGCVACGTSLLIPLFTTLGVTTSTLLLDIANYFLVIASGLMIFSIYKLSALIATIRAS